MYMLPGTRKGYHYISLLDYSINLKTPPSKERGVLSGPSTLPTCPAWAGRLALVWVRPDFEADGLRHGAHLCSGKEIR